MDGKVAPCSQRSLDGAIVAPGHRPHHSTGPHPVDKDSDPQRAATCPPGERMCTDGPGPCSRPEGIPMAHMPGEPEAFGEQVAKILRRNYPERRVEMAGPLDLVVNGRHLGLENLFRMVKHDPS